ncbi:MAG: amidohydrolase family protein, partial [Pseudomonadota bacterium]
PESVTSDQIKRLASAGVVVSLGHSDCGFDTARAAFAAGAQCVTHLFNAMRQLGSRDPGLVGAALTTPGVRAGLIADGIHVHPAAMQTALTANPDIFLVTDAMATLGSDITQFTLNGRRISRSDGRLTLDDRTLAGADLDLPGALRVLVDDVGLARIRALRMVTTLPASCIRSPGPFGSLQPGKTANVIHLGADFEYLDGL